MPDQAWATRPLGPDRGEQGLRIDLELAIDGGGDVGGRPGLFDHIRRAEKQPAHLAIRCPSGMSEDLIEQVGCNLDRHNHIGYRMDPGVSTYRAIVPNDSGGWRLDRALAAALTTLSRERLKTLISIGNVLNEAGVAVRDPAIKVMGGAAFDVTVPAPAAAHNIPQDIPLVIAYEDEHLIVVDKPAGLVVHPAAGNYDGTLVNALLHHCDGSLSGIGGVARPGIVHRIDKDTSGLIVAAKTDRTHEGLAAQFARHTIDRRYCAIVAGLPLPTSGKIEASLARSSANRQKMAVVEAGRGKHAITHYRLMSPLRRAAMVECRLETGRTHQVRVHMASIGHPLLGDPAYGRSRPEHREMLDRLNFKRQALHAAHLGFIHPVTSAAMAFESYIPADMQALLSELAL